MKTNARRIGRLSLLAACLTAWTARDAAADQITQRYTITGLGLYTGKTWATTPNGLIYDAIQEAPGIDNAGNISYRYGLPVGHRDGSPYSGPMPADLNTTYPDSIWATGSAGQYTVGNYYNQAGELAKFLWDGKTVQTLNSSNPSYEYAVGVNDRAQVLATNGGRAQVLNFLDGSVQELYSPYATLPMAINHNGLVVGRGWDSEKYYAFLIDSNHPYDPDTWLQDLIPVNSGWTLGLASGINDHGQIVGVGLDPDGKLAYYRLDPVPEPSTIALALTIVAAVAARGWWKKRRREIRTPIV